MCGYVNQHNLNILGMVINKSRHNLEYFTCICLLNVFNSYFLFYNKLLEVIYYRKL